MESLLLVVFFFFFSSRRRHTRSLRDWSSDVCSSDLPPFSLLQLFSLVVRQAERRADVVVPTLADLLADLLRLGSVRRRRRARVPRLLPDERGSRGKQQQPYESLHHPSKDSSKARSSTVFKSSRLTSCTETTPSPPDSPTPSSTCFNWSVERPSRSAGADAKDWWLEPMIRNATAPPPTTITRAAAIRSHWRGSHNPIRSPAARSARSRSITACAVASTSSRSAARAPSRCASFSSWSSFTPAAPSVA